MYHGLKFSASGTCVEIPSSERIPKGVGVRTFPVVEQDLWIWVWMGEASRADASLIPRAVGHEDLDYTVGTGELQYDAHYQLIHDNLLDLSHLSYVHEKTLGRNNTSWGRTQPTSKPLERWLRDTLAASYAPEPEGTRVDQWSTYDFVVPGVFVLQSSGYPVGTAEQLTDGPDGLEPMYKTVTSQAVTPVTESSTVYYYSGGEFTRHTSQERLRRQIELFGIAFREDKVMTKAQQAVIHRSPGKMMMTLSFDRPVGQFRRLLAELIEDETRSGQAA